MPVEPGIIDSLLRGRDTWSLGVLDLLRLRFEATLRMMIDAVDASFCLERDDLSSNRHPALAFCLSMISAQTLRVCREGKPVSTFPDHV
jgi:hypothetical protein